MYTPVDLDELSALLEKNSRTFAAAIPLLSSPLREDVGLAYLLFRIIDTLEDAATWPRDRRIRALRDALGLLDDPSPARSFSLSSQWLQPPLPTSDSHCLALLAATPRLFARCAGVEPRRRDTILDHVRRTTSLMLEFQLRTTHDGRLELGSLEDLRQYCYAVAGIVGELLTELFLLTEPALEASAPALRTRSALVGEALQLTNILKDAADDAEQGRFLLPAGGGRDAAMNLARRNLESSRVYVSDLQSAGASPGILAFVVLPLMLASRTLQVVEQRGPGARLGRSDVFDAMRELARAQSDAGVPLAQLIA